MNKVKLIKVIIVTITLSFLSTLYIVPASAITLKNPADLLKKKKESSAEKINLKDAKTGLMAVFFESSNNYLIAQELLLTAYGKNTEAAQVKEAIEYAKDSGVSDSKKLKNSLKVTTAASKSIEKSMNDESFKLTAEGKANYAKSLPFLGKGIIGTIKLRPETQSMIAGIKGNPMNAIKQLGGLAKVIPNIPGYITTVTKTSKLVISGAKAKKIEGADNLDSEMDELAL
ncbi:hypothetical protein N9B15_01915 [Candidatus Pelagibacter sp.]|jgi:hypothetical protein|nr:hypothetical protein [Candidatus Pelagibacter sp.]|tara:strand:+ start:265 stop:951 length:687 start_codon:yes stop_codon:yes gene_type:complete